MMFLRVAAFFLSPIFQMCFCSVPFFFHYFLLDVLCNAIHVHAAAAAQNFALKNVTKRLH